MPVRVKRKLHNLDKLRESLKDTRDEVIQVGITEDVGATKHEKKGKEKTGKEPTVAEVASFQEYGWVQRITPKQAVWLSANSGMQIKGGVLTLPPRPFLRGTLRAEGKRWRDIFGAEFKHSHDVHRALEMLGGRAVEDVKETIRSNGTRTTAFPDRSPLTMALYKRMASGHGIDGTGNISSRKALVLDAVMLKSIKFKFKDE